MGLQRTEPGLLQRLRRAIELSGLIAEPVVKAVQIDEMVVSGRLVQAIHQHLLRIRPAAAEKLVDELAELSNLEESALLIHGKGYTYFHVIHFLFEFAVFYSELEADRYFVGEVGWEGSGLHSEYDQDIVSLIQLLVDAMPAGDEGAYFGKALKELGPLFLEHIFPSGLFVLAMELDDGGLAVELRYADIDKVRTALASVGLADDIGALFVNSALQVQETLRKGLAIMLLEPEQSTRMTGRIEQLDTTGRSAIANNCRATWAIEWDAGTRLSRRSEPDEVLHLVRSLHANMHRRELEYFQERVRSLQMRVEQLEAGAQFQELIGGSVVMRGLYQLIEQVGATDLTALVRGESGTGKELVARAIHHSSHRRERAFIAINCAAFPDSLLESELFGYEKGAFTGADRSKPGRFELADGGTLFLDEVGDIPLPTQVKLLRVLETQSFERLGGTKSIQVDIRFIAATNRPLEKLIAADEFREDFYFRLNVLPVALPSLREHKEDIPQLARHFADRIARRSGRPIAGIARGAIRRLVGWDWPGNVRELQNTIERAVALYARDGVLDEAAVAQALGLEEKSVGAPMLNMRQRELVELLSKKLS